MRSDYREKSHTDWGVFAAVTEQIKKFVKDPKDKLILDAGCGHTVPQVLLLHNLGYKVIGIDMRIPERCKTLKKARFPLNVRLRLGRMKRLTGEYFQFRKYYEELKKISGRPLSFKGLDAREMDITRTEFPDGYFDIVISNAVFEHLPDVDAACKELKRITKKDGYLFIGIHLFTSLSGGHRDEWRDPVSVTKFTVPPWDHLRNQLYPVDPTLNRLRAGGYRKIFERHFTIADWIRVTSQVEAARRFLSPEIRKELRGYSEDELLIHATLTILRN